MYNPAPLGNSAKLGDIGILTQDGFHSLGNLYTPSDQERFSIMPPPSYEAICQPEKFKEGETLHTGLEDMGTDL